MQLDDFIVDVDCSVIDAMKQIDRNAKGIVYVCKNGIVTGALTDGDIRRHIMQNGDLNASVFQIANMNPKVLSENEKDRSSVIMKEYQICSVPITDQYGKIQEIHFAEKMACKKKEQIGIPVVIMAGGKGTRLYPYTQILPKPLIPIGDKTITEHIMDHFVEYGCSHFDMIVNYKKNFIKSYFLDNENKRDISFIEEEKFLGTGGGLKLLEGRYDSAFFMSNCDILVEEDYAEILRLHQEQQNLATMVCAMKRVEIPYGIVELSDMGQAVRLNEKPELSFITNTGLYILEPEFLKKIPENTFIHITDLLQKCINDGENIGVYPISGEHWMDMGQFDEMERMRARLEHRKDF